MYNKNFCSEYGFVNGMLLHQLKQLVAIPSISCTQPSRDMPNEAVIHLLAQWFSDAGFCCQIMPVAKGKANLIAIRAAANGSVDGGLVLAGHSDTVPIDEALWHSDPFGLSEREGKLYGLGVADMKGFFPIILQAAKIFIDQSFKAPLIVVATCDEETSMAGARALANSGGIGGRYALIGEPTNLYPARMHKGVMLEKVVIEGSAGHSSDPRLGLNALDAMHDVITELKEYRLELRRFYQPVFPVPMPTLNLGCIHGGDNPNRICGLCELQFDLRFLPGMDVTQLRKDIGERLAKVALRHGIRIDYMPASPGAPAAETPSDSPFVQMIEKITGQRAGAVAFGTEAPYFRQLGMDTLILGPGGIEQAHQPNEYLRIDHIDPMIDLLRQLIQIYCVQGGTA